MIRILGPLMFLTMLFVMAAEVFDQDLFYHVAAVTLSGFLGLAIGQVTWSRRAFVIVGAGLVGLAMVAYRDWGPMVEAAFRSGCFIGGFFVALTWLRNAAGSSPSMQRCGQYLASQKPGRRYAALTAGGHLFGLMLNYGSITLLGSMVESAGKTETDAELRRIRTQRMLVAIQRGFIAILCWSPLTFSLAITTALTPGASWTGVLIYGLVSTAIVLVMGWLIDSLFKPKLGPGGKTGAAEQSGAVIGTVKTTLPLLGILALLMGLLAFFYVVSDLRMVVIVMIIVPVLSLAWIALQVDAVGVGGRFAATSKRGWGYVTQDLGGFRSEIVLLVMAGFIGTLGAQLAAPVMGPTTWVEGLPTWLILVALIWIVPITGQLGMNPILTVSLITPLLPAAEALGTTPDVVVLALTAGWALSGISSPFTATTMLVGSLAGVSAARVGLVWNGFYVTATGLVLTAWVVGLSLWLGV